MVQDGVGVLCKTLIGEQRHHGGFGNDRVHAGRHLGLACSIDNHDVERWVVLGQKRPENLVEPCTGIVGDNTNRDQRIRRQGRV